MGGKAEAPEAPDYTPIAQADAAAAERQFQLGEEQIAFGKDQFNKVWPYAQAYLDYGILANQDQYNTAARATQMYEEGYKPVEQRFLNEVQSFGEPWRIEENASRAMTDVSNTFQAARASALAQLESYGIDPSTTRFGALDLTTRIQEAAAKAAAGTQSRLNTEAQELALMGEAINVGRGYPGAIASSYKTATDAGKSTVNSGNETSMAGTYGTGQPSSYFSGGNTALGNWGNALNMGFNNAATSAQIQNQNSSNFMSGIGQLIGGGISAATMFGSDRRLKTDIERVGYLDNGLPVYSFRYRGQDAAQIGLMADEVEKLHPDAVASNALGYKFVDYAKAVV